MPSKKPTNTTDSLPPERLLQEHVLFFPLLLVVAVLWYAYRWLFAFPVWFDETIGKALFFGLPVWFYIVISKRREILRPLRFSIMQQGMLLGVALGGIYGFVTSIMSLIQSGAVVQSAQLFQSSQFWFEFIMALFTGFWETIFFFCFVATVIFDKYKNRSLFLQVLLVVAIFLVFHLPYAILRFEPAAILSQVLLLTLFSLGQALVFFRWRNAYALMLSHAIWGLVLLFHG